MVAGGGVTLHLYLMPLGSEVDSKKRGMFSPGEHPMLPSDLGKEVPVGSEIARPQVIASFSPHPHFCPCSQRHRGGQAVPLGTL